MKKVVSLFLLIAYTTLASAQSKKALLEEINTLKAENQKLKNKIQPSKNPTSILNDKHKKASYSLGVMIGSNIKTQNIDSLDIDLIIEGVKDLFYKRPLLINQAESSGIVQAYMKEADHHKYKPVKQEGERFLAENKNKPSVFTTASGLQYKILTKGTGLKKPQYADNVTVHYTGMLIDGSVFDSSVKRGSPNTFGVNQVIAGWTEVLQLMTEGDKWIVYIPQNLAYGERGVGSGQIPPYSTLIFEIELIKLHN